MYAIRTQNLAFDDSMFDNLKEEVVILLSKTIVSEEKICFVFGNITNYSIETRSGWSDCGLPKAFAERDIEMFLKLNPLPNHSLSLPHFKDGIETGCYLNIHFSTFAIKPATYLPDMYAKFKNINDIKKNELLLKEMQKVLEEKDKEIAELKRLLDKR